MRRVLYLTLIACLKIIAGRAQCTTIDAVIPGEVCLESEFTISNNTTAASFEWDFCPTDLQATPSIQNVSSTGIVSALDMVIAKDGNRFYGFVADASTNSIFRLNFGDSRDNVPTKTNLGNVNDLFQFPNSVSIVQQGDVWLGVVANGGNEKVILLNFGNSLMNSPTASVLYIRASGGFANIDVVSTSADAHTLLIAEFNTRQVTVVNYPQGFLMPSGDEQVVSIPGSTPIDVQSFRECDGWTALVLSFEDRQLHRIDFGNSFADPPDVSRYGITFTFEPYRLSIAREGKNFYGFVTSTSGGLSRLDFGGNVEADPTIRLLGAFGMLSNSRSLLIDVREGEWTGFMINYSDGNLFRLAFRANCGVTPSFSRSKSPDNISYSAPGTREIAVAAIGDEGVVSMEAYPITVVNALAAQFSIQNVNSCVDSDVAFSASVTHGEIAGYEWEFGDGGNSTSESPVHVYEASGAYKVALTATDVNSCITRQTLDLKIFDKPVSSFSLPSGSPACTNEVLNFANASVHDEDAQPYWRWLVNSVDVSTSKNLTHAFDTPGPHTIGLVAGIPGCESYSQQQLPLLTAGPTADFDVEGNCHGDVTRFQNASSGDVASLLWDFGDGNDADVPDPTHVFADAGSYTVALTLFSGSGCEVVKEKVVQIKSKPVIDFEVAGPPSSCSRQQTTFNNYSFNPDGEPVSAWSWNFDNPNDPASSAERSPKHMFSEPGVYNVSLMAQTLAGCQSTATREITILPAPSTEFVTSPACASVPVTFTPESENTSATFYWEIGTSYYNSASPVHTFGAPGNYRLYLEVTSPDNCVSTRTETIRIPAPLTADFSVRGNCVGVPAEFTDMSTGQDPAISREWIFGDNETFSGSPVHYTFQQPGSRTVTLRLTGASGCVYQSAKQIQVVPQPVAAFSPSPPSGGYPLEVTFTNTSTSASQFHWDFGDGSLSDAQSPVHIFTEPGSFEVRLTASNAQQCKDVFSRTVSTVSPMPDVDIEMLNVIDNPDGTWKLIATIHNKGNTLINDLPLDIDFGGILKLRHVVGEPILPASKFNFVLNTLITNRQELEYLCVTLTLDNDLAPIGNKICKSFDDEPVGFRAYPNPATDLLNLEWVSAEAAPVFVSLSDNLGRSLLSREIITNAGLNSYVISLAGFESGLYFLVLEKGGFRSIRRMMVVGH